MNHGAAASMATLKRTTAILSALVNLVHPPLSSEPFPIEVSRQKTLCVFTRDGKSVPRTTDETGSPRNLRERMIHHPTRNVDG